MSAEIVWGRGRAAARRAAVGGGGGGGLGVRLRPLRARPGWEGGARAAAAAPQVSRAPGLGLARSERRPSGEPGPESLGSPRRPGPPGKPSREAPPQGQRASARRVPGVAGPSPPPGRSSGASCAAEEPGVRRHGPEEARSWPLPFSTPARGAGAWERAAGTPAVL